MTDLRRLLRWLAAEHALAHARTTGAHAEYFTGQAAAYQAAARRVGELLGMSAVEVARALGRLE